MVVTSQSLVKNNFEGGLKLGDSVNFIASADSYFLRSASSTIVAIFFCCFGRPLGLPDCPGLNLSFPKISSVQDSRHEVESAHHST
jgi:hypothetical protein